MQFYVEYSIKWSVKTAVPREAATLQKKKIVPGIVYPGEGGHHGNSEFSALTYVRIRYVYRIYTHIVHEESNSNGGNRSAPRSSRGNGITQGEALFSPECGLYRHITRG